MHKASWVIWLFAVGCTREYTTVNNIYIVEPEGGDSDGGGDGDILEGAPKADTKVRDFTTDVWGIDGHSFWLAVKPEQVAQMNADWQGGGGYYGGGDIYQPGGENEPKGTYASHLFVTDKTTGDIADFDKVGLTIAGQSTGRTWSDQTIPNLHADVDDFENLQRVGGNEHLRFNNGQVGTIYREALAARIFRELEYPAPRTTFAWVGSNVWGSDVKIPYTVVELYKTEFCDENAAWMGGGCVNMWESTGDITPGANQQLLANCQTSECDNTRAEELAEVVASAPQGDGFQAATADYIDWPSFHKFQCLNWMLWIGDDYLHNSNNVVLVERNDGKFMFLPYSIDISAGQDWYQNTPLTGYTSVASGCQQDAACWAETLDTCDVLIQKFIDIDPPTMVDEAHATLEAEGMLRGGDEERYTDIRRWYEKRMQTLPDELQMYRDGGPPDTGGDTGKPPETGIIID